MKRGRKTEYGENMTVASLYIKKDIYNDLRFYCKYNGYGSISKLINDLTTEYYEKHKGTIQMIKNSN